MTFGQFISILRARWLTALGVLVLVVGAAIVGSLLWPKRYTATASVVVDVKPDPISALIYPGLASPAVIATQVDVIQSDRVSLRVVRNLKLAENPQIRAQWREETGGEGAIEAWLAESLQKSMDVKPSRESNVITISYKAPDPRFAAGLANAFVQAYIDTTLEMRVDPARQYSSFFDLRSKEARDALDKAQTKLSVFQRDNGIIAGDERIDVENARLNELSSHLVALQALMSESTSRQAQVQAGSAERMQEVLTNPLVAGLKSDLAHAEAKLQELSARYGDNHPQVIEIKANIAELRTRLDTEVKRITSGVGVTSTINRQREVQARNELEAQRSKVLKLKAVRDQGSLLQRDLENAQRTYDAVLARLSQTSLESQSNQSNVSILTQATAPGQPSSPRLLLNAVASVFIGILLAVGVAVLLEVNDRRLRTVDDVALALALPVLGVIPRSEARRLGGPRLSLIERRLLGRPTAPAKGT